MGKIAAAGSLLALLAAAAPVEAQWLVTPLVGVTARGHSGYFDPDAAAARRKLVIGTAVSKPWRSLRIEAEIAHMPGFFSGREPSAIITSSRVFTVTGNVIARVPRLGRFHPYAVAGLGAVHVRMRDVADVFPVSEWQLMFDAGAGVMMAVTKRIGIGADARYFRSRRGDGTQSSIGFGSTFVDFWRLSTRMSIALGKPQ
jgi:opacity protein-like surface antigen